MYRDIASYWWIILLRGILSIVFGVLAVMNPGLTALSLATVFGVYALVDGFTFIGMAIFDARQMTNRLVLALEGALGVTFGLLVLTWPGLGVIVFLQVIAIWALATGIIQIISAIRESDLWLGLAGLLSVFWGIFFFRFPGEGALALLTIIGVYAIIFGILFAIMSFRVRNLRSA